VTEVLFAITNLLAGGYHCGPDAGSLPGDVARPSPTLRHPCRRPDDFDDEPPPEDHPLFALDNIVLTPHSAGLRKEAAIRMAISTARNALVTLDGNLDPSIVVNREVL
jgi:hypothetical protein